MLTGTQDIKHASAHARKHRSNFFSCGLRFVFLCLVFAGSLSGVQQTLMAAKPLQDDEAQGLVVNVFRLNNGDVVIGELLYEGESHYRILTEDGPETVIFRSDVLDISLKAAKPEGRKLTQARSTWEADALGDEPSEDDSTNPFLAQLKGAFEGGELFQQPVSAVAIFFFILLGLGFWFVFGVLLAALILWLALKIVGKKAKYKSAVWFQIKISFLMFFLGVTFAFLFVLIMKQEANPVLIVILSLGFVLASFIVYFARLMIDFSVSAGKAFLVMILQSALNYAISIPFSILGGAINLASWVPR